MERILLLDTSVASANLGDDIIMECCKKELEPLIHDRFLLTLPTHVSPFHWYQVLKNSNAVRMYSNCQYKFACGTNLLIPNLLTHYPQWNINLFNYKPLTGTILLGVGAGAGAEGDINKYTKYIYTRMLNKDLYHSMRDERSKLYMNRLGIKALNTGCVTMWMLTPEHCQQIPRNKSSRVVFTITTRQGVDLRDQQLIDILDKNYEDIYFWPQGHLDRDYLKQLNVPDRVHILPATKEAYDIYLTENDTDYIGTRLHGGVYAMRHKRRAIIIAIDERAKAIKEDTNLNCIDFNELDKLSDMINSEISTEIKMPFENIKKWKAQFGI